MKSAQPIALVVVALALAAAAPAARAAESAWGPYDTRFLTGLDGLAGTLPLDADGDGDLDLFVYRDRGRPNRLYLNDGRGDLRVAADRLPPLSDHATDAQAIDADGDGDTDLLIDAARVRYVRPRWRFWSHGGPRTHAGRYLLLNDGAGRFLLPPKGARWWVGLRVPRSRPDPTVDLDGDGLPEALQRRQGQLWLHFGARPGAQRLPRAVTVSSGTLRRGQGPGLPAFFLCLRDPTFVQERGGYGLLAIWWERGELRSEWLRRSWRHPLQVVSADLDGDRRADLVVCPRGGGSVGLFLGDATAQDPLPYAATPRADAGPPLALQESIDPRLFDLSRRAAAEADWQGRVRGNHDRAVFVPLGALDPSRPLLLLMPGIGMRFTDLHALQGLSRSYQVLIGIGDYAGRTGKECGEEVGSAVEVLLRHREAEARRRGLSAPPRDLRIVAHSFGTVVAQLMLRYLAARGELGDGGAGAVRRALFVALDGPWRGADSYWALQIPGVRRLVTWRSSHTRSELSLLNRSPTMNAFHDALPPAAEVTTQIVDAEDVQPDSREPLHSCYSGELHAGELERLHAWLARGATDTGELDTWAGYGLVRRQGLQNLVRALMRDADYPAHAAALRAAARQAPDAAAFADPYDAVLDRILDRFRGEHTPFMWTDPRFMPWLHGALHTVP